MTKRMGRVTERTFYPAIIDVIHEIGGSAVQEVQYNSAPDIQFVLQKKNWLLSVKIGEDVRTVKSAFLQYLRHKEESRIPLGILLLLPDAFRKVRDDEDAIRDAIRKTTVTTLIDAGSIKEELRDRPFSGVMEFLVSEVLPSLVKKEERYRYSLPLVISLLKQQVDDMMAGISLDENAILRIITDRQLLADIGALKKQESDLVGRFLAAYIFLSQVMFLRLLVTNHPRLSKISLSPVSRGKLRAAFREIRAINYRAVYGIDVLDSISDDYLEDTFKLIWGLAIEGIRYELPGRIFHSLMPSQIRKMLAAFYTRPYAAEILAKLAITRSNMTVFDPACGSGTILSAAYQRKYELFKAEGRVGDPHRLFCEHDIFGADIMPFAVHLTSANLAAMNPAITVKYVQITQGDSLDLNPDGHPIGLTTELFPRTSVMETTAGEEVKAYFPPVDVVMMNPPFTKVERGIRRYANMGKFHSFVGGEVGLWGHFIPLADTFLKEGGIFAAVLPINILRGRESEKVRRILFEKWTPLYILKPVKNYGFSEWAEYRDVIVVAQKKVPHPGHKVKFCLVKKDLTKLDEDDITAVVSAVKEKEYLRRSDLLDIDVHTLSVINEHFSNMMWFCGTTDFNHRDAIVNFVGKFANKLGAFPKDKKYRRTGFRPDQGVSKFLFLTRATSESRIGQAFLRFTKEGEAAIVANSPLGVAYSIGKQHVVPSMRTPVGLDTMDITNKWDYIVQAPYKDLQRVCRAANATPPEDLWKKLPTKLESLKTHLVLSCRINPFSPETHLVAFFSPERIAPSDQLNLIAAADKDKARALCTILNSSLFFAQFFLLKEESTGRFMHIRLYDLDEMALMPPATSINALAKVFDTFGEVEFPALCEQFDQRFFERYEEFWKHEDDASQRRTWSILNEPVHPHPQRLDFDLAVCKALDIPASKMELTSLYGIFVKEMIIPRRLKKD